MNTNASSDHIGKSCDAELKRLTGEILHLFDVIPAQAGIHIDVCSTPVNFRLRGNDGIRG